MTATRSTARAGALQAGDAIDKPADDLLGALDSIISTRAGVAGIDALNLQLTDAERAVTEHAAGAERAQLLGEDAEQQHAAHAGVLTRRVARIRLAIDKATERLAEVAEQERRSDAEAAAARAVKTAGAIETMVGKYITGARTVAELLTAIETATAELVRDRAQAREAGVECNAMLPHESRFVPERREERKVVDRHSGPTVTDASGRSLDSKPITYTETTRAEHVIVQQRHAPPSILTQRAVLPNPDGGAILDRNADNGRRHFD